MADKTITNANWQSPIDWRVVLSPIFSGVSTQRPVLCTFNGDHQNRSEIASVRSVYTPHKCDLPLAFFLLVSAIHFTNSAIRSEIQNGCARFKVYSRWRSARICIDFFSRLNLSSFNISKNENSNRIARFNPFE